jgi:hypothetical protein
MKMRNGTFPPLPFHLSIRFVEKGRKGEGKRRGKGGTIGGIGWLRMDEDLRV